MESISVIGEKCLLVKEKWAFALTLQSAFCYRPVFPWLVTHLVTSASSSARRACARRRGGIGAHQKRQSLWPDLPPRDRIHCLFSHRLKRLFFWTCDYDTTSLRHRDSTDDGRTAASSGSRHRRRHRRTAARQRRATRTWPLRSPDARCRSSSPVVPTWEGGGFRGSEQERRRLLEQALELGADYVDVEWRADFEDLVTTNMPGASFFRRTTSTACRTTCAEQARAMRASGAAVVKIAVKASSLTRLRHAARAEPHIRPERARGADRDGRSRTRDARARAAVRVGVDLCRRRPGHRPGDAPASCSTSSAIDRLALATDVYGLVGSPIAHSLSPAMHNAAFTAAGIDAVYLPLPAADRRRLRGVRARIRHEGRERHHPVQGRRCSSACRRPTTSCARSAR